MSEVKRHADIELLTDVDGHIFAEFPIEDGASIIVRIIADAITEGSSRLITWCWEYQRMIHAEIMTHRAASRNAASSRAIPASKLRERVLNAPAIPVHWGQNQAGMQASAEVEDITAARAWWLEGRDMMAAHHAKGEALGLHKQIVNRQIEPWMMISTIVSLTDHANLFHLRNHDMAEPNFRVLARLAWELFHNHMPVFIKPGGWHMPYVAPIDMQACKSTEQLLKLSTARCARVSYLTHDGKRDHAKDFELHDTLAATATMGADPMHASPFEHPAQAVGARTRIGNFEGWKQYRKFFPHENGPDTSIRCYRCGCWGGNHVRGCS